MHVRLLEQCWAFGKVLVSTGYYSWVRLQCGCIMVTVVSAERELQGGPHSHYQ